MRIAVSSASFHASLTAGELRLAQVPAACAVLGFELVELNDLFLRPKDRTGRLFSALVGSETSRRPPDLSPLTLGRLEKGLRAAKMQLVCFTAENDFVPEKRETLSQQVRYAKAVIGAARYLNCSMVRLWLTRSPNRTMDVATPTVQAFREVTETAAKAGLRLTLEHRFGSLEEIEAVVYVVQEVRSFHLGACLNFSQLPANAWQVALRRLAPYTIHVHARSREFDAAGNEKNIHYPACLATLERTGYQGVVSIEYVGTGDPLEGILATKDLIQRCLPREV